MQSLPLEAKVTMTELRVRDWVEHFGEDGVYVSFSGGKDSTVLLMIARRLYPNIKACFADTGLEFPEIRKFVQTFDNVDVVKPKKSFKQVCKEYGFPLISKEVSEVVYGARKYLTKVLADSNLERTNERTNERHPYQYWYERITGTGAYQRKASRTASPVPARNRKTSGNGWTENQFGIPNSRGGTITSIENLEELASILNRKMVNREGGNNQRLAQMLGLLTNDKDNPVQVNIPNETEKVTWGGEKRAFVKLQGALTNDGTIDAQQENGNRSMFNQERWTFFLDAPFEISNKCCYYLKKEPMKRYQKQTGRMPITAQTADESRLRLQVWLKQGCNAFNAKKPISNPMSFWTEQDVLQYIYENNIPIAPVYGDVVVDYESMGQIDGQEMLSLCKPKLKTTGAKRTGCMLCGYGAHIKHDVRFVRLKETHPKVCKALDVIQNSGVTYREAIEWVNENNGKGEIIRLNE